MKDASKGLEPEFPNDRAQVNSMTAAEVAQMDLLLERTILEHRARMEQY